MMLFSKLQKGQDHNDSRSWRWALALAHVVFGLLACATPLASQETGDALQQSSQQLQQRVQSLEAEVAELKAIVRDLQSRNQSGGTSAAAQELSPASQPTPAVNAATAAADRKTLDLLRDTTINVNLDGYYGHNFNNPVGRVNLLRTYDVSSNQFSLNQAGVILDHLPDLDAGRRWGGRLDLQFGQATETLQGNPANEPRPQIYRNLFQAYGTYVIPVGKRVTVDFGKWASALGIEGNYTKDQMNYSRGFWFDFLPFYHMGLRASIPISDRFAINYWLVNGANQTEDFNGAKDQLFGFTAKPRKSISWTFNYHLAQEHPDVILGLTNIPVPAQPGLSLQAITPAPNGRTHMFDSYATWQATPKLTLAVEGDYVIQRLWRNSEPGMSSAPSHTAGGAAYVRYEFTKKVAVATRAEYMSDRGGLFSGLAQALKENTVTFDYKLGDGFLMRYEWRRDFSNQPTFLSDVQNVLRKDQNTATLGLIWWWGRKEGSW